MFEIFKIENHCVKGISQFHCMRTYISSYHATIFSFEVVLCKVQKNVKNKKHFNKYILNIHFKINLKK